MLEQDSVDRIKEILQERNITQAQFSDSIGMSQGGVANLLKRRSKVSKTLALAIQSMYGVYAKWLLTGEAPKYVEKEEQFDDSMNAVVDMLLKIQKRDFWHYEDIWGLVLEHYILEEFQDKIMFYWRIGKESEFYAKDPEYKALSSAFRKKMRELVQPYEDEGNRKKEVLLALYEGRNITLPNPSNISTQRYQNLFDELQEIRRKMTNLFESSSK